MKNAKDILNAFEINQDPNDEASMKMMKEAYLNCPQAIKYVKELGIPDDKIDDNILKIYDLVKDLEYCRNCPGIEQCQKENPLVISALNFNFGIVSRELKPCKKILEKAKLESQFIYDDFKKNWYTKNIKDLDGSDARAKALLKFESYKNDTSEKWIYLTGALNSGRTYLAAIMCIELAKISRGPICFINAMNRLSELQSLSYSNKPRYEKMFDNLCNAPVLVMDDLGSELKNDFVRNILLQILIKRSSRKLFTIITSDYSINEMVSLYSTNNVAAIEAKRIGNILKGECEKEINLGEIGAY